VTQATDKKARAYSHTCVEERAHSNSHAYEQEKKPNPKCAIGDPLRSRRSSRPPPPPFVALSLPCSAPLGKGGPGGHETALCPAMQALHGGPALQSDPGPARPFAFRS
jgi:hypothetical protein